MKSNYKPIGNFIQLVDKRNNELKNLPLVGVTINKKFIPSVANTVGSNMKNYKLITKNQFACSLMQVRRDGKIPVALMEDEEAIISQAYPVFEIININELLPQYLMMWMSRSEFDREACFYAVGGVRGSLEWEDFCAMKLQVPSIEKQREIVKEYKTITDRIRLNEQLNQKLEETAQEIFNNTFKITKKSRQIRLGDLIEVRGGFSYQSDNLFKGKAYLIGMGCISFVSRFLEDGMRLYSDDYPEKHQVFSKDIVIATRQQSENMPILGYPAMIPPDLETENLIVASNLYKIVNNSYLCNEILYQLLRSKEYIEHIKLNAKGTTVGMITKDAIEDFYFHVPDIKSINMLEQKLKSIVELLFLQRREIKNLITSKEMLLSKMATTEG